ncbi:MAG: rod shape-determining protein RodA [Candidatus Omnitrophica bacterium]|nr:rod shape-determining protein RodA [Candidatus Omnitrophota bacterium]
MDIKELDKTLLALVFLIFIIGLFCLYSASYSRNVEFGVNLIPKQLTWMAIGLVILVAVLLIDYQKIVDMGYFFYGLGLFALFLVLIFGHATLGAQRWFTIAGFNLQPSEFNKIVFIIMMASYLGHARAEIVNIKGLLVPLLLTAPPFILILAQPDLGTALILVPVLFAMLLVAGARPKHLIGFVLIGLISSPIFWNFLKAYQKKRLLVFLNPDIDPLGAGYTIIQSKIAIGSGGFFGKGWLAGTQNQLNFLPERHTDFIFSVIGEEWGFFGAMVLVGLYFLILKRGLIIIERTTDIYGRLVGAGILTMLGIQVFVNISMTIGLMPVVGLPLPLISYGGSSLWTTLIAVGLLLNVGMRRTRF